MSSDQIGQLTLICREYGIDVTEDQAEKLCLYLQMVLEKNKVINLTAIKDFDKGLVLHLLDSLLYLRYFEENEESKFTYLDIGTGAGFPGIPIALMRSNAVGKLCDSVKKKITAVQTFVDELGLSSRISLFDDRIEDYAKTHKNEFDYVVVRAVGPLSALVEYAAPVMKNNGMLIVSKGVPSEEETEAGMRAAEICGLDLEREEEIDLPQEYGRRTFFVYRRNHAPSVRLPRQVGMALKHPLS